jgi:enoyl-CoA hydratase/carnithine racemase
VHEIIGPLVGMEMPDLLRFTRMTGDLVKAIRACPQVVIAGIDGICAGAGAAIAMAVDLRIGTPSAKVAYLFTRVGLAGCDMGACAILPRIIGQGRAAELLFTGRSMSAEEGERWGFFNKLVPPAELETSAKAWARDLANGPTFAHSMTKKAIDHEWNMGVDQAIEAEAQAQAICMETKDFERAYRVLRRQAEAGLRGQLMADRSFLSWPFFEAKHRDFASRLSAFGKAKIEPLAHDEHDADATTKNFVSMLAAEKFLNAAVPDGSHDVRTLCLARETLAYHSGLADFAFAMQGLGTGSIVLFGSPEQKAQWLPAVRSGKSLGAFAMSEPEGGSDVAALRTTATKDGDGWRLNAARLGSPTAASRASTWSSRAPAKHRGRRACRPSSCRPMRRA